MQKNFYAKTETGEFIFSTNIHLSKMERALVYDMLGTAMVVSGSGVWQIGDETCHVKEGDIIFLSNLEPRRVISGTFSLETFGMNITTLPNAGALECLRIYYGRNQSFSHVVQSEQLSTIFREIRNEITSPTPSFPLMLAYAIELLVYAGRFYDEHFPKALDDNFRCNATSVSAIAASAAYINENLSAKLRIGDLAKLAGMSEGHYTRLFKKYVSVTPVDYIAKCRIRRFLSLVSEGKTNILDTAFACGFTSASGFYKTFQRICGHAPTDGSIRWYGLDFGLPQENKN